jgi:Zn-dependent protease with chaperone function
VTTLALLGFAAVVAALAHRVLIPAAWVLRSPRLGLAAWVTAAGVIALSAAVAVVRLVTQWPSAWATVCAGWLWCAEALRGGHDGWARLADGLLVGLLSAAVGRLVVATVRFVRRLRAGRRAHAEALALVSRRHPGLGVWVIDADRPAAYALGRQVVLSSGALDTLPADQLAAVIAHERAHATGRHRWLADAVGLLAGVAPWVVVFTDAAEQVARLVEIRADEVAAARHGRLPLARAIVACATGPTDNERATVPTGHRAAVPPAGALAASGGHAVERVQRLLEPPVPLRRGTVSAAAAGLVAVGLAPALIVAAGQAMPVLGSCLGLSC